MKLTVHAHMQWEAFARDSSGRLQPNSSRFPSGIPHLSSYMRARNLSLGIYTSIEPTCCSQNTPGMLSSGHNHYEQDVETLVSWGVASLKLDKCGGSRSAGNVSYPLVSSLLSQAAHDAGTTPVMLSCSWPDYARAWGFDAQYRLAARHCNLWRVFDDISDDWSSIRSILEFYAGNATMNDMNDGLGSYWAKFRGRDGEGYRTFLDSAGPGHWNDADVSWGAFSICVHTCR